MSADMLSREQHKSVAVSVIHEQALDVWRPVRASAGAAKLVESMVQISQQGLLESAKIREGDSDRISPCTIS